MKPDLTPDFAKHYTHTCLIVQHQQRFFAQGSKFRSPHLAPSYVTAISPILHAGKQAQQREVVCLQGSCSETAREFSKRTCDFPDGCPDLGLYLLPKPAFRAWMGFLCSAKAMHCVSAEGGCGESIILLTGLYFTGRMPEFPVTCIDLLLNDSGEKWRWRKCWLPGWQPWCKCPKQPGLDDMNPFNERLRQ